MAELGQGQPRSAGCHPSSPQPQLPVLRSNVGQGPDPYWSFLPLPQHSNLDSRNICFTSSIKTQLLIVLTIHKKTGALDANYIYLDQKNYIT